MTKGRLAMNHSTFFVDRATFDRLDQYFIDDYLDIIDSDDDYVMGYCVASDKYDHSLFLGQKVDRFEEMWNLWIDRSGIAYFVPWYSHNVTAAILQNATVDELECKGWIHISNSRICNYQPVKATDKQYDTLSLYCEHNHRDMFSGIA
jgi:hypothetical protein